MHLLHGIGRDGPVHDRNTDVLEPSRTYGCRLVERAWLHGIAIVEHDLPTGGLEGFELRLGWLAARNPARHGLGGVGKTCYGCEKVGHAELMRNAECGIDADRSCAKKLPVEFRISHSEFGITAAIHQ